MPKFVKIIRKENSEDIFQAVRNNEGYCVCQLAKTPDSKCPCREFREQSSGDCHCGLYTKIEIEQN